MPLLLVNKEQLLHFQNFEEADLWLTVNEIELNDIIIIPEDEDEEEEIEGFLDNTIEIKQK